MRTALLLATSVFLASTVNSAFVVLNQGKNFAKTVSFLNCEATPSATGCANLGGGNGPSGGSLIRLVTKNLSPSSLSVNRTTYSIGHYPCPHVGARHEFLTVNVSNGENMSTAVGNQNDVSFDAYSNYLAFGHAFLYSETNSIAGAQPSEFLKSFNLCNGPQSNSTVSWNPLIYKNWSYTDMGTGNSTTVHTFTKCANLSANIDDTFVSVGNICFTFSIAGMDYVAMDGGKRLAGDMKVDYNFTSSDALRKIASVKNASSGLAGVLFTSADTVGTFVNISAKSNNVKSSNNGSTGSFEPNVMTSFSNGAAAYVNWVNYINVTNVDGTQVSANVNVAEYNTTTFKAVFNVSNIALLAGNAMSSRSMIIFSFEVPLATVSQLSWDPSTGVAASTSASDSSSSTTASPSSNAAVDRSIYTGAIAFMSMTAFFLIKRF